MYYTYFMILMTVKMYNYEELDCMNYSFELYMVANPHHANLIKMSVKFLSVPPNMTVHDSRLTEDKVNYKKIS